MKNQQKNQSILKIKVISFFMLVFISVNSFATETQSSSSDQEINSLELRQNRAQGSEIDDRIDFTVINPSEIARSEIVRISLPVEENITNYKPANWLVVNGKQVAAQTRVITGYPNGSPRRIMLSFEAQLEPNQELSCQYDPKGIRSDNVSLQDSDLPAFYAEENGSYVFSFPTHRALIKDDKVILKSNSDGQTLATLEAYGPELDNVQQSNISVIETGTYFTWLRWTRHGSNYTREVDFQVDRLGHIKITQRILRHLFRNDWTPDFGFKLTAMESKPVRLSEKPLHFLQFDPESTFVEHPELIASLKLSNNIILSMVNPLALRQNRGTLEADIKSDETTVIRTSRIEPVKDENNKLMIQEGIWRVTEVLLYPEDPEILATSIDHPLVKKIDWEAYDKIYNTGPPLQLKNPVLNEMVQRVTYVLNKMSINGDDWGNMTSYDPTTDTATINSMLRFNHCQYVWEDYFRTGDPLLRRIAVEWSENYRNFSVYWGPRERFFGGGRNGGKNPRNSDLEHGPGTYMERQNNAIHFCTKGFHNFWLTYEETGDPCFKEAAEAQARWSAEYVHTDGQTRNIGLVTDFIKLFDYTGDSFYLDQALRLWEEFKASQCPDLLFTQGGKFPTGNDLFIRDDEHGYQHPFYKAYIIQYATNSLPYLLKHLPDDQRLRDTILTCNNWMTKVQTPGGGWGYPGPTSPLEHFLIEYSHGLMMGYKISPNEAYLDTVQRALNSYITLYEKYGYLAFALVGWEQAQNQEDLLNTYNLGTDRNRLKDFTHGSVEFGSWPDTVAYLQVVLRDYLRYRGEDSLLTKGKFVKQILQLPTNLPKERIRYEEQNNNQNIQTLAEPLEPDLSLPEAASISDVNIVKLLLENGVEVNSKENSFFKMALHRAALGGHKDIVELLINKGANVNALDSFHSSSLHYAVEKGYKEIAELLITNGADVNVKDEIGLTPFDIALSQNRKEIAELLIDSGANIDFAKKYPNGDTPLLYAIKAGRTGIVELLITEGADINTEDENGQTPLYMAVSNDNKEIVKLLIDKGADVNTKNENGQTPLDIILSRNQRQISRNPNHSEIKEILLAHGAEIMSIHSAVKSEDLEKVKEFLDQGIDVNVKDESGMTPLLLSLTSGHVDVIKFLIENGADVNVGDKQGYVPVVYAVWNNDPNTVKLLLDNGADVNAKDTATGYSLLHWAILMDNKESTELFLAAGADVNGKSNTGETPLDVAAYGVSASIGELLVTKGAEVSSLHTAAYVGDLAKVKDFVNEGIDVNQKRGMIEGTALHAAASGGHKEIVEFLIREGADVNAQNRGGQTPLYLAQRAEHKETVEILLNALNDEDLINGLISAVRNENRELIEQLLNRGVSVNAQDNLGLTPLHVAASRQDIEIIELLLAHDAKVNVQDKVGRTPLHYAAGAIQPWWEPKNGDIEAARILLDHGAEVNIGDKEGKTPLYYSIRLGKKMTELLLNRDADPNYVDPRGEKPLPSNQGRALYVATDGNDSDFGTLEQPLKTIYAAIMVARPGDTIYVRGGTYCYSHTVRIEKSGRQTRPIHLSAYPGETPVFDFYTAPDIGFLVRGAYWHIKGIVVTNAGTEGISVISEVAHHNIIEQVVSHSTGRTGIAVSNRASHNLILDCDAHHNFDFLGNGENADGFEVKFSAGTGNILIGNRSWNNADDGYDFWDMGECVRLERCYAWRNGENLWDYPFFTGNGNGFKLGRGKGRHILMNCLAWNHHLGGFNLNGNETGVILYSCTAFNNFRDFLFLRPIEAVKNTILKNNLSNKDQSNSIAEEVDSQSNSWDTEVGITVTEGDFLSLDDSQMSAPRNPDGSIPYNNFLRLAPGSAAIDAGTDVNLPYIGKAPDLGAFEYDPNENVENYVKMLHQYVRDHDIEKINEMLEAGSDINEKDWLGYAPLHWACYFGYADLVTLLIDKGADPNLISDTGRTCLEITTAMDYEDLAELLLKHGAKE